ncbi:MAG: T9SS type A sorting domain-containing protein [Rhodothermales bacterium]
MTRSRSAPILFVALAVLTAVAPVRDSHAQPSYAWHTMLYNASVAEAQTVDADGNIITVGIANESWLGNSGEAPVHAYTTQGNAWILKVDADGNYLWHTFIGDNTTVSGRIYLDVVTDAAGDIYLTGNVWTGSVWNGPNGELPLEAFHGGNLDGYVAKISSDGAYVWHRFIGPDGSTAVEATHAVAIDSKGDVYTTNSNLLGSYFVTKFSPSGAQVWQFNYGTAEQQATQGDIYIDSSDNVFVAHRTTLAKVFNGPGGESPVNTLSPSNATGFHILKVDSTADYQWHTFLGGQVNGVPLQISSDSNGDLYVAGDAFGSWLEDGVTPLHNFSGAADIFVEKTNADGVYQWHTFWGGDQTESGISFRIDSDGRVVVSGQTDTNWLGANGTEPIAPMLSSNGGVTIALGPDGSYQWHSFLNYPIQATATNASSLIVTGDGRYETNPDHVETNLLGANLQPPLSGDAVSSGLYVLKYNPAGPSSLEERVQTSNIRLHQNYPNPFSGSTAIRVELDRSTDVHLAVYDLMGRHVRTLASGTFGPGVHTFEWDAAGAAPGVYHGRLESGVGGATIKLVVGT